MLRHTCVFNIRARNHKQHNATQHTSPQFSATCSKFLSVTRQDKTIGNHKHNLMDMNDLRLLRTLVTLGPDLTRMVFRHTLREPGKFYRSFSLVDVDTDDDKTSDDEDDNNHDNTWHRMCASDIYVYVAGSDNWVHIYEIWTGKLINTILVTHFNPFPHLQSPPVMFKSAFSMCFRAGELFIRFEKDIHVYTETGRFLRKMCCEYTSHISAFTVGGEHSSSGHDERDGGHESANVVYHHNCLFDIDNEQVYTYPALIHYFETEGGYDYFNSGSGYRFFNDPKCVNIDNSDKCESRAFDQFCCDEFGNFFLKQLQYVDDSLVPLPETSGIVVVSKRGKITYRIADPPQGDISTSIFSVNGSFYCHNQSSVFIFKLKSQSFPRCSKTRGVPRCSKTIFQRISDLWSSLRPWSPMSSISPQHSCVLLDRPDTVISSAHRIRTITVTPNNFLLVLTGNTISIYE